ncbi:MAG: spermidine synthase [Gemmatimonadales bacterium]
MTRPLVAPAVVPPISSRMLPMLAILFVGSGCAALIYEVVWFQLVELVIGSSAVSLGVLLATFMGGMCLGSVLLPRLVSPRAHPLRVYAALEASIGLLGLLIIFGLPSLGNLYASIPAGGMSGIVLRGVFSGVCLLVPTMCMGATLPAIARWIEATPTGVSWLGFFYGSNIAGAVAGCVLAGFYLLRVYDMVAATYVAVAINAAVALVAWAIARRAPHTATARENDTTSPPGARLVYWTIALSGVTALAAEVVWTRLLSLMLGATVYTFSLILAVVLVGLGVGSSAGAYLARVMRCPRVALGWCQLLLPIGIAWTAYMIARSLPYWPVNPSLSTHPWLSLQFDLMRCAWTVLPATILWGASFPLAIAGAAAEGQDAGKLVGRVYAANTVGGIVGAIGFSMIVIPWLGTQNAQRLMIAVATVAGLTMLVSELLRARVARAGARRTVRGSVLTVMAVLAVLLAVTVAAVPPGLIGYGRFLATYSALPTFLFTGEGMNSSIAVSELPSGYRNFHVSGKVEASSEPQDMRLQRMLGHLAALVQGGPRSVLVVGFGAGVTAGSFVPYPGVQRIVICELEPLIPRSVGPYFSRENYNVLNDPRVELVYDDARHFILTTKEKFDVITSDPIHPWVRGAATLYTREYLDLVKQHLNPGGVMTEWVPLYESHSDAVKSEIATFFDAFPGGTAWANNEDGHGYDLVMLGQPGPTHIDIDAVSRLLANPANAPIAASLEQVGITSLFDLFGSYAGQRSDLAPWLKDAAINRDRNLRLQYIAGLENNSYDNAAIFEDLAQYRRFPEDLFVASAEWKAALSAEAKLPRP